eukprot:1952702-Prymnesium_polylepis.2
MAGKGLHTNNSRNATSHVRCAGDRTSVLVHTCQLSRLNSLHTCGCEVPSITARAQLKGHGM